MGNFTFDWVRTTGRHLDGIIGRTIASKSGVTDFSVAPVRRDAKHPVEILNPASPEGAAIVRDLEERSAAFGTTLEPRGSDVSLTRSAQAKVAAK